MGIAQSKAGPPLSKATIKKADAASSAAVITALAESASFAQLAATEALAGQRIIAQKLIDEFKLAVSDPSEKEIKISLTSTLTKMVDAAGAAVPPVSVEKKKAPLFAVGAKPLSKPLILKGDEAALKSILAAFASEANFKALAKSEAVAFLATWSAAGRIVANFKLAMPKPTAKECTVSIESTATKLAAEAALPSPPKLTKKLLKAGGKPAVSAVVALFAKHPGFQQLASAVLDAELDALAAKYEAWNKEPLAKAAERAAARKLAGNFKLALPKPTEKEITVSLKSTLDVLTRI